MNVSFLRSIQRSLACSGLLVLALRSTVAGQTPCDPALSIATCLEQRQPTTKAKESEKAKAKEVVQQRSTGGDSPATGPATTLQNFLPRFAAAVNAPGLSGDTTALGLNLNVPLNDGVLFPWGVVLQFGVIAHRPQLFSGVADSIPAAQREATRKKLEQTLSDYDDAELTVAVSIDNGHFGRTFDKYSVLVDGLASAITARPKARLKAKVDAEASALDRLNVLADRLQDPACSKPTPEEQAVGCYRSEDLANWLTSAEATAAEQTTLERQSELLFKQYHFSRIADLVDNQPQLSFRASLRPRRDLVGPRVYSGQLTVETGFANVNRLRKVCGAVLTAQCFSDFVTNQGVADFLSHNGRASIGVTLASQATYNLARKDTVNIALGPGWKIAPAIGYGFYLGQQPDGADKGRLDLQYQFVRQLKDAQRQNQSIARVSLTEPVSDQSSAIFGITWADKPEFVGTADAKVRANVGLSYHLVQKAPK